MKVILTGSTGFIGSEVLTTCLAHPSITSIISLQRRAHPTIKDSAKLTPVILSDFTQYPDAILTHLKDADAVIWSMGTYNADKTVEVDYPAAFQRALILATAGSRPINYVYLGGAFCETDQNKTLYFLPAARRVRGLAQTHLLDFSKQNPSVHPHVVRPAGVLKTTLTPFLSWIPGTIAVGMLAAVMVDLAVNGGAEEVLTSGDLGRRGEGVQDGTRQGE